ncbi:hypothetical protein EVAR_41641_1 [Eumeta japonica]|uniref:Uncharacterized protein n=1 Tax=Eumeta variegata TaxID=151549 RepID=A0A4C1X1Q3_EUMVA|nr:hypothetical protein EVAR_41641_1 [Eumeta japonica]
MPLTANNEQYRYNNLALVRACGLPRGIPNPSTFDTTLLCVLAGSSTNSIRNPWARRKKKTMSREARSRPGKGTKGSRWAFIEFGSYNSSKGSEICNPHLSRAPHRPAEVA